MTTLLEPESERDRWLQQRRRVTVIGAFCFIGWLVLVGWLLLHPSGEASPARRLKNALFGNRVTEAVERAVQQAREGQGQSGQGQSGQGQSGQGQSGRGKSGQGKSGQGQAGQGQAGQGQAGAGQAGRAGAGRGGQGNPGGAAGGERGEGNQVGESGSPNANERQGGQGSRRGAGSSAPANPQHPENNPPELAAPPERSIGWLDRFFGVQRADATNIQAGEGGTGTGPGAGNTNATPVGATNLVAAEFTQSTPPPAPVELARAPQPRNTNQPAIGATNATINDRMEQLLNQHRAGRGDLRISLMWNNKNDLDLHVVDPSGEEIYYSHRTARSGGILDIDMNASPPLTSPAVENVYWPERSAPLGTYRIYVNHYRQHDRVNQTSFLVRVLIKGRTTDFPGVISFGERKKLVYQFTLALPASAPAR